MKENINVILASATVLAPLIYLVMDALKAWMPSFLKGKKIILINMIIGGLVGAAYATSFFPAELVLSIWAGVAAGAGSVAVNNVATRKDDK